MSQDERKSRIAGLDVDYGELGGFLSGKDAAILDWRARKEAREFASLCMRLYGRNWVRRVYAEGGERLDRLKAYQAQWRAAHREQLNAADRRRRAKSRTQREIVCEVCGAKKRVRALSTTDGRRPRWCSKKCSNHWHAVQRAKARNRGLRNMGLVPAILAALRDGPLTLAGLRAALPDVKPGSLATKLTTMVQAGELIADAAKKGRCYALPSAHREAA